MSYGFGMAGAKPVAGAEIDPHACRTYQKNLESRCFELDLGKVDPEFFVQILEHREPFAVIGGPPCQGFSTAGSRKSDDPRNRLIFNLETAVGHVQLPFLGLFAVKTRIWMWTKQTDRQGKNPRHALPGRCQRKG